MNDNEYNHDTGNNPVSTNNQNNINISNTADPYHVGSLSNIHDNANSVNVDDAENDANF